MGFEQDAARITQVMTEQDPAFAAVSEDRKRATLDDLAAHAVANDRNAFLLAAMRAMALANNAHSRVIPNAAMSVLPLRIVLQDGKFCVPDGDRFRAVAVVNGVAIRDVVSRLRPYLAGNATRQDILAGPMLAWPPALALAGVTGAQVDYTFEDGETLSRFAADGVPASSVFSQNETGAYAVGADPFPGPVVRLDAGCWHVRLADMKALSAKDIASVIEAMESEPLGVIVDLRGNPGGSFLTAVPLVRCLKDLGVRCAVLVDGYTFSAAIVVAVLVKGHLGARCRVIGSPVGDNLAFWAEGDLVDLPQSGARVRYSTAWHDWAEGRADATTPPEIAEHMIGIGTLDVAPVPLAQQVTVARDWVMNG
ncbi:MAG: S41 family peptidase [Tateyamaria sp.]